MKADTTTLCLALSLWLASGLCASRAAAETPAPKRLVLIAGQKSHGPEGNRIHDYPWSVRLLKATLESGPWNERLKILDHYNGWPTDPSLIDTADAVMVISDGRDGDFGREAPHLATPEARAQVHDLLNRGGGLIAFHFSTFAPDALGETALDWLGGYFDWQTDGAREWYSAITTQESRLTLPAPDHPILRGVRPFTMRDEFYFDLRLAGDDPDWTPILNAPDLPAQRPQGTVVAWAMERANGARGFATTCGHFYDNWQVDDFRKTILNALVWAAGLEVPDDGVQSPFLDRETIAQQLDRSEWAPTPRDAPTRDPYADSPYWYRPGHPVEPADPQAIEAPPGFFVEKVYSADLEMGSFTTLANDPQGRLYLAAQHRPGIWRLTPPSIDKPHAVARLQRLGGAAEDLGYSHGLLVAFDSLFVTVSEANDAIATGLYRLQDTDGDGQFDRRRQLMRLDGSGEHGPHHLVLGPREENLYLICGNGTPLPEVGVNRLGFAPSGPDRLMPPGYEPAHHTDAGWILRMRPDGSDPTLIASGLRNAYDLAFDHRGALFTYDSDMEWDLGAPWYRPTRALHVVPGAEFGWRGDAAKWPATIPDSVPSVVDIGPGSPTGLAFGYPTAFPAPYRNALFAADWTFATIYAIHLSPDGATYSGVAEPFVGGVGLPVTDMVANGDGALYFTVGGRRLGGAVYRIVYRGSEVTVDPLEPAWNPEQEAAHATRQRLETPLRSTGADALEEAFAHLNADDRSLRYAARVLLEAHPLSSWRERVLSSEPFSWNGALALARVSVDPRDAAIIRARFAAENWANPHPTRALTALRALEYALARAEDVETTERTTLGQRLSDAFPTGAPEVDREWARIASYLGASGMIPKLLDIMDADQGALPAAIGARVFTRNPKYGEAIGAMLLSAPMVDRMSAAHSALWLMESATPEQRRRYFGAIDDAQARSRGGYQYAEMWARIRESALEQIPPDQRARYRERVLNTSSEERPRAEGPGENWTSEELIALVEAGLQGRDYDHGASRFVAAGCADCHALGAPGPAIGPDLSAVGRRFTAPELIGAIVNPSATVSDQYRVETLEMTDGSRLSGRIVASDQQTVTIATNALRPSQTQRVAVSSIRSRSALPISTMPAGLLNAFNAEEVLDLLAYLLSGASPDHEVFR